MFNFAEEQIDSALERVKVGLDRYWWIQQRVFKCDVSIDLEFQRRFAGFYRVRRALAWRTAFFSLMERAKRTRIEFSDALGEIRSRSDRIESSFASKLVATLDPCHSPKLRPSTYRQAATRS
jgi:hypothetical protein